jgi:hypothetical protein
MSSPPPSPPSPPSPPVPPAAPDGLSDEVLGAFAAGELSPEEAAAVRARAAVDPVLAARAKGALRVEAALREDSLLPVPLPLLARVLDRVREEAAGTAAPSRPAAARAAAVRTEVRWAAAAAVLALFLGIVPAALGVEPLAAAAERIAEVPLPAAAERLGGAVPAAIGDAGRALAAGASSLVASSPPGVGALAPVSDRVPGGAAALGLAGAALLAAGLTLARRLGRAPTGDTP